MPPLEELEKARADIPASMARLLSLRTMKAEAPTPHKQFILTGAEEVAGIMEFLPGQESENAVFRLSMRGICPSQWLEALALEKTVQSIPSPEGNVRVRAHNGIFNLYKNLFKIRDEEGRQQSSISAFIEDLTLTDALNDLSTLRIQIEGDFVGGCLGQLAALHLKTFMGDYGVSSPHIRILTYGSPTLFNAEGADFYNNTMGQQNSLHLNFRGMHDPIVHNPLSTLRTIVQSPRIVDVLNQMNRLDFKISLALPILQAFVVSFPADVVVPDVKANSLATTLLRIPSIRHTPEGHIGIQIAVPSFEESPIPALLENIDLKKLSPLSKAVGKFSDLGKFYMGASSSGEYDSRTEEALQAFILSVASQAPAQS
ncbi:MAG: hypothetical protein JSS34_06590 [Proteobacteria bacterium]|nr:hypothetical protein [Pseudomonadota bacterium]